MREIKIKKFFKYKEIRIRNFQIQNTFFSLDQTIEICER